MPVAQQPVEEVDRELSSQLAQVRQLELTDAAAYLQSAARLVQLTASSGTPPLLHAQALSELGNAHRVNGEFPPASQALNEAIAEADRLTAGGDRSQTLGLAHLRRAIVCDLTGRIIEGMGHLEHASRHCADVQNKDGQARCDMVRAALYMRVDAYEESERSYLRALEHYRETEQAERAGVVLSNLSVLWRYMDRVDDAVKAGREAVSLATGIYLKTMAIGNLAFALGEAGQLEEGLNLARQTSEDVLELGDPNYAIEHKRAIATILMKMGQPQEARDLLEEALAEARQRGYSRDTTDIQSLLSDAYRDLGDFENAYRYHVRYLELVQAESQKKAASQLELQKWRLELEIVRQQAEQEREGRRRLAESLAELSNVHEKLSVRAEQLEWSSYRDSLTELANRRYFDDRLHDLTKRSIESGADVAVLILDLDNFKGVNDRFGHLIGDNVLRQTARILEKGIRRSDLAARMGGEEFTVLLTSELDQDALHALADKLRSAFEHHDWNSVARGLRVTTSIGAARMAEVGHNPLSLLDLADRRLYAAKRAGRNRVISTGTGDD